jgi:hypothetical protein
MAYVASAYRLRHSVDCNGVRGHDEAGEEETHFQPGPLASTQMEKPSQLNTAAVSSAHIAAQALGRDAGQVRIKAPSAGAAKMSAGGNQPRLPYGVSRPAFARRS